MPDLEPSPDLELRSDLEPVLTLTQVSRKYGDHLALALGLGRAASPWLPPFRRAG